MKELLDQLMKKSRTKRRVETERERVEHLEWCKMTALKYIDAGDIRTAWTSMYSDLGKHPGTANHPLINVGITMHKYSDSVTPGKMRQFINRFK